MKTLIIYDTTGYVILQATGNYKVPTGIPYIEVEIPEGKQVKLGDNGIGIDVSATPNQAILEDIPLSEVELLKSEVSDLNIAMASIIGSEV